MVPLPGALAWSIDNTIIKPNAGYADSIPVSKAVRGSPIWVVCQEPRCIVTPIKACAGQGSFYQSLESRAPYDRERPIEQRYCYSDQANIGIFQEMGSWLEMIQWSPWLTIPHRQSIAVLIEMVRCQHPDKGPKGSYAGAPNKNHSGRSVAKLPNGHKSDDIDHWNRAEPETSNDQRKILATQEFLQPEAQLWSTIFASAGCHQRTLLWAILLTCYWQAACRETERWVVSIMKERLFQGSTGTEIQNFRF